MITRQQTKHIEYSKSIIQKFKAFAGKNIYSSQNQSPIPIYLKTPKISPKFIKKLFLLEL